MGYPLYCLSYIFIKDKRKWVFGHKNGFVDNAKYLYLYALKQEEVKVYWITQDKNYFDGCANVICPPIIGIA